MRVVVLRKKSLVEIQTDSKTVSIEIQRAETNSSALPTSYTINSSSLTFDYCLLNFV